MPEQTIESVPPVLGSGYVIRILHPDAIASSLETRVFETLDQTELPLVELVRKLSISGVGEFLIHIVNQITNRTERTLQRKTQVTQDTRIKYDD